MILCYRGQESTLPWARGPLKEELAVEARHFDRLTRTVGATGTRRGALVGLAVGSAALLGNGRESRAKKKKKTCPKCQSCSECPCPQRACCACRSVRSGPPTACFTIEGLGQADAASRCSAACGGADLLYVAVSTIEAGRLNSCTTDLTCHSGPCPNPITA